MTWTGDTIGSAFYIAWAVEFNSPPEPEELSEDFTGLRHHRINQWSTEITCLGVIKSIEELLAEHPVESRGPANCGPSAARHRAALWQATGRGRSTQRV